MAPAREHFARQECVGKLPGDNLGLNPQAVWLAFVTEE